MFGELAALVLDPLVPMVFLTILLLTFAVFLVITGAFTAYFGSGKSRKIGGGLLVGGLAVGIVWGLGVGPLDFIPNDINLLRLIIDTLIVLIAAIIGAVAAIGLFLLAIMKS